MTDQSKPQVFQIDESALPDFTAATPKERCWETLLRNGEEVLHYVQRAVAKPEPSAIVVIAACDVHGAILFEQLMPGRNFVEEARRKGGAAFGYAIMKRGVIKEVLTLIDMEAFAKLARVPGAEIPVVVIDHGVAEVFSYRDFGLRLA